MAQRMRQTKNTKQSQLT